MRYFDKLVQSYLVEQDERKGYMLGQHSARTGEHVRGMPRKSTIADIGFIKRDPEEDVKLPNSPTPGAVKATFAVIAEAFAKLFENKEVKEKFISAVKPFVDQYNVVIAKIPEINTTLQRKASLEETLKMKIPGSDDEKRVVSLLEKVNEMLNGLVHIVEPAIKYMRDNEDSVLSEIQNIVSSVADDPGRFKSAMDKYTATVKARRSAMEESKGLEYNKITPVISYVKFFNNTQHSQGKLSQTAKAIKTHRSSRDVLAQIGDIPGSENVTELHNTIKHVAGKLTSDEGFLGSEEYRNLRAIAQKHVKALKPYLETITYHQLLIALNNFFNKKEGSEGALMGLILNNIPKELLKLK